MKVAFQGEPGAYSEEALFRYFGDVETQPCETFEAAFEAVASHSCEAALIPIENSLAGSILQNYDLLVRHDLHIVGEYLLRVRHCLIGFPGARMEGIQVVMSHPQALDQCAHYLRDLGVKLEPAYDTAGSVKMLKARKDRSAAAVASRRAAEIYEMEILQEGIEDNPENHTALPDHSMRSCHAECRRKDLNRLYTNNQPGALFKALSVFALRDLDLTKIESRPLQGKPWEYLFYIDFLGCPMNQMRKKR